MLNNGTRIEVCLPDGHELNGIRGTIKDWNEGEGRYAIDIALEPSGYRAIYFFLPEHVKSLRPECVFND